MRRKRSTTGHDVVQRGAIAAVLLTLSGCASADHAPQLEAVANLEQAVVNTGLQPLFTAANFPQNIPLYFGDVDGNQATDVLSLNTSTRVLSIRKATMSLGLPTLEATASETITLDADTGPLTLVVRDFDGDGRADVLQMRQDGVYTLWRRNPTGTAFLMPDSSTGVARSGGHGAPSQAAFGDFDADGAIDSAQVSLTNSRVAYWRFWLNNGTWSFDRTAGGQWDLTIPAPLNAGATYTPGSQRTGNFAGSSQKEILIPASTANGSATEATVIKLNIPGATHTTTADSAPLTPSFMRKWAQGIGPATELTSADVDRDGYDDLLQLASSGGVYVWRGGPGSTSSSSTELGLPSASVPCMGGVPARSVFADLDDGPLDLVRAPIGRGDVDVWRGRSLNINGNTVSSFSSGTSWATIGAGANEIAAFQAQTWQNGTTATPGRNEIALHIGTNLVVYQSTGGPPPLPPLVDASGHQTVEGRIVDGFKVWRAAGNHLTTTAYPTEAPDIDLSNWRFTGSDDACKASISEYEQILGRIQAHSVPWFAAAGPIKDWSTPADKDPIGNSDEQARQIINFFVAYRVLGQPRFLNAAQNSAWALLRGWPRFQHTNVCSSGLSCETFVQKNDFNSPAPSLVAADPNQNMEVALAFALLMNEPTSTFYRGYLLNGRLLSDAFGTVSYDLWDIIGSEVAIAFSMQRDNSSGNIWTAPVQDGGVPLKIATNLDVGRALIVHESTSYMPPVDAYDTRYGAYALANAVWLQGETVNDPLYAGLLGSTFETNLKDATGWLNRWSRSRTSSLTPNDPVSYYCPQGTNFSICTFEKDSAHDTLAEWDAWNRVGPLYYLNRSNPVATCPDQILNPSLHFDVYDGFQIFEQYLLSGVPRAFFSSHC